MRKKKMKVEHQAAKTLQAVAIVVVATTEALVALIRATKVRAFGRNLYEHEKKEGRWDTSFLFVNMVFH